MKAGTSEHAYLKCSQCENCSLITSLFECVPLHMGSHNILKAILLRGAVKRVGNWAQHMAEFAQFSIRPTASLNHIASWMSRGFML